MAYLYDMNGAIPTTGAAAIRRLKTKLVAAGWVVTSSGSTGTGYSSNSDIITTDVIMAVANAWFAIRDPAGHRSYTFQRGSTNLLWRIKYSANPNGVAGFTGGSPSATCTPSATDEQITLGGGTDASPTFSTVFGGADGSYRIWIGAGDAAVGYSWYFFANLTGSYTTAAFMFQDVMRTGTYSPLDLDPAAIYTPVYTTDIADPTSIGTYATAPYTWFDYGGASAAFQRCVITSHIDHGNFYENIPDGINADPASGFQQMIDCVYLRSNNNAGTGGLKGIGNMMRLQVQSQPTGQPYTYQSAYDYGGFDDYLLPTNALMTL